MAKNKTSFNKDNQPINRRGKSERNKIIDAMERMGKDEDDFYDLLVAAAFSNDVFSTKEVLTRIYPLTKQVSPSVEFEFDEKLTIYKQATQVISAISKGDIPPDTGNLILSSITSMLKIQEVTDIEERLKKMEEQIESPE